MCDSDNHQGFIVDTSFTRRSVVLDALLSGSSRRPARQQRSQPT